MSVFASAKEKAIKFATDPRVIKVVDKATKFAAGSAAALTAFGMTAINSSALDVGMTVTAESAVKEITSGVSPFTEPAVIILCGVSGIRLGMKLLKSSAR